MTTTTTAECNYVANFTLKEREHRWGRVRKRMVEEKLDCLISFPNQGRYEQLQANTRYLTQIGGFATEVCVVFPLDGEVTALVQSAGDVEFWGLAQNWISKFRNTQRKWAEGMIAQLKEQKLPPKSRVGVIGLKGLIRAPDGVVPWYMFERVKEAFPDIEFVNATHVILETRAVKSDEEVGFIQKAEEIAEKAVDSMFAIARAGVKENILYSELLRTMLANGAELPTMIYWVAGNPRLRHIYPVPRPLKVGDVIANEIEAKYAGYIAQISAPAIVGPITDRLAHLYEKSEELFNRMLPLMLPGKRAMDVGKDYVEIVQSMGFKHIPWPMHGRGLGDDLPVMQNPLAETDAVFEENQVLIFKPGMIDPKAPDDDERVGDTVVITKTGAKRLGKRPLGMTEIPV